MGGGEGVLEPLTELKKDDFLLYQDSSSGVFKQRHWGKRSRASGRGQQRFGTSRYSLALSLLSASVGCNAVRVQVRSKQNFDLKS